MSVGFFERAQLKMIRRWQEGVRLDGLHRREVKGREESKRDGRLPLRDEPTSERIKRQVEETDEDQVGTGRTDGRSLARDVCVCVYGRV